MQGQQQFYFTCNNAAAEPISAVFVAVAVVNVTCQCLGSGGPAPQYQVSTTGEAPPKSARMALQPPSESSPTLQGQLVPTMCGRLVCSYSLMKPGQAQSHKYKYISLYLYIYLCVWWCSTCELTQAMCHLSSCIAAQIRDC